MIVVAGSGALALGLTVVRWIVWKPDVSTRPSLGQRIGPANWGFSESWASTLTLFGTIISTLLFSQVLPFSVGERLTGRELLLLSLTFGFAVVLAPFVYSATASRAGAPNEAAPDAAGVRAEGSVGTFLVASTLTMWGAFGQMATLGFICGELSRGDAVFALIVGVLVIVVGLMVRYSWVSIRWVLEDQAEHSMRMSAGAPGAARPSWTLL